MSRERNIYPDPQFYPEYQDEEALLNSKHPFEVVLPGVNALRVQIIASEYPNPIAAEELGGHVVETIHWSTNIIADGMSFVSIVPGEAIAKKISSRILDAPVTKRTNKEWLRRYDIKVRRESILNEENLKYRFGWGVAHRLSEVEDLTGVASFQVLMNHGAVVLDEVVRRVKAGEIVAGIRLSEKSMDGCLFPDAIFPSGYSDEERCGALSRVFAIEDGKPLPVVW